MIRTAVLRALAFLLCAGSLAGQGTVVKVAVSAEDDQLSKDVADILRGKLGSTLRYALTEVPSAVITVDVVCVAAGSASVACSGRTSYYPDPTSGLHESVEARVGVGPSWYVAQGLFDAVVRNTSDEKLAAAKERLNAITARN